MNNHICPWWLGYFLINPLRRLFQNPEKILSPYINKGMTIMDIGTGMGYFSLPMAELVGETGIVIGIDMQEKMLKSLVKRSSKAGLLNRIKPILCSQNSLNINDLTGRIDFALAFAVVHEVPDKERLFSEIYTALKKQGMLLIAEPKGHVTAKDFAHTTGIAKEAGFTVIEQPIIRGSISALLTRNA